MQVITILLCGILTAAGKDPYDNQIDKLVLHKSDVTVEDEETYIESEADTRIAHARASLIKAGRDAWPILLEHLDDKRESTAVRAVSGPYTVSQQCYWILWEQLVLHR